MTADSVAGMAADGVAGGGRAARTVRAGLVGAMLQEARLGRHRGRVLTVWLPAFGSYAVLAYRRNAANI